MAALAQVGQAPDFWQALLIGAIAPFLTLVGATIIWLRRRGGDKREDERREDTLWGYTDSTGIRHVGVLEAHEERIKRLERAAGADAA